MAFTLQAEIDLVNETLDRLAVGNISLASQSDVKGVAANLHYARTLAALFRSYEWPFLTTQAELSIIKTLILDKSPTSAWAVEDTITGISSGTTAEILTVTSDSEYEIIHISGDFTAGETITNATVYEVYYEGVLVEYEDETVYWYDESDAEQVVCGSGFPSVSTLTPNHKWTYQYHLPNDFSRLIKIYEDDGTDYENERWTRQGDKILTHYDTMNIDYIKTITDPSDFDPLFAEVLILRLALKLIPPLIGIKSPQLTAEIKDELRLVEAKARVVCAQENNQTGRSDFNLARFGS